MSKLNLEMLDKKNALCSETALSSDLDHIRYITMDGKIVAKVRSTAEQDQDLAMAKLLASSARLKRALEAVMASANKLTNGGIKQTIEFNLAEQLLGELEGTPGMNDIC